MVVIVLVIFGTKGSVIPEDEDGEVTTSESAKFIVLDAEAIVVILPEAAAATALEAVEAAVMPPILANGFRTLIGAEIPSIPSGTS